MSKPTFMQTILKRPSQSYLNLQNHPKDYYSSKPELRRIAADTEYLCISQFDIPGTPVSDLDVHYTPSSTSSFDADCAVNTTTTTTMPMATPPQVRRDQPPRAASATVAAALQQRQPSISSVVASGNQQGASQPSRQQPRSASGPSSGRTRSAATKPTRKNSILDSDDSDDLDGFDSSDEDNPDVFFTPNQSPRTSMASSSILFPRQARNNAPRQASRKSLRVSNTSSGLVVAPGISASNSGSSSVKPIPGHVNSNNNNNAGASIPSSSGPAATTAIQASLMPLAVQQLQQGIPRQRRSSYTNAAQNASTSPLGKGQPAGSPAPKPAGQQQQQGARRASAPITASPSASNSSTSTLTRPTPPPQDAATPPSRSTPSSSQSQSRTPTRSNSVKTNDSTSSSRPAKAVATTPIRSSAVQQSSGGPNTSLNSTTTTPTPITTTTTTPSASAASPPRAQERTPTAPKAKPLPKISSAVPPALSHQSSTNSLTSTSLENHSDIFSVTGSDYNMSGSTAQSTPVNSGSGSSSTGAGVTKPGVYKKPAPQVVNGAAPPQPPPMRSNSLRATRTPIVSQPRNVAPSKPGAGASNAPKAAAATDAQALAKRYSYTADDWGREFGNMQMEQLVHRTQLLAEKLDEEEALANGLVPPSAALKRNASLKKDEQRKGALTPEYSSTGTTTPSGSSSASVDKGKSKEKDGLKDAGKLKKKKGTVEREVVYYTAKHGMPRPLPPDPTPSPTNGAVNGVGSSTTRSYAPPVPGGAAPPPPGRNGFAHHHQPSLMMNMRALMEESESSDGRLSVVTERDEPETPTAPTAGTLLGGPLTKEPHTSSVFNAFAPLRPTNSTAAPVEMMRRRSRSMGEHDAAEEGHNRQSSVTGWADEYKDILAKTKGKAMASGTSLLSSPSQQSFAYRNAMPVPSGDLPSNGTPGYTSLHLARAPPGLYVKDGEVHSRLPGPPPVGGFMGGVRGAMGHGHGVASPNGHVDLTANGAAQTTVASVEVIRGLGSVKRGLSGVFGLSSLGRRRTVSGGEGMDLLQNRQPQRLRKGSEDIHGTGRAFDQKGGPASGVGTSSDKALGFTSYRRPPNYVPSNSVLVQVWAVGVDAVDAKLVGLRLGKRRAFPPDDDDEEGLSGEPQQPRGREEGGEVKRKKLGLGRSLSLRARLGSLSRRNNSISGKDGKLKETESGPSIGETTPGRNKLSKSKGKDKDLPAPPIPQPEVGFVPGRSFVGRVMDTGWDVRDEQVKRGDWVIGLLDVRKCGALTEFIVVDRHRVWRVPHPADMHNPDPTASTTSAATTAMTSNSGSGSSTRTAKPAPPPRSLTLEQYALLPLCAIPAYRATRTLMQVFSDPYLNSSGSRVPQAPGGDWLGGSLLSDHEPHRKRRALVLHGHDGVGAMLVQMLSTRGWRVSVHVPVPGSHDDPHCKEFMVQAEDRVRKLGGEEVVFDDGGIVGDPWWDDGRTAAVRVINGLRDDGDVFDAVLDTLGGKEIREASERLLKSQGVDSGESGGRAILQLDGHSPVNKGEKKTGPGQFTTIVGEVPERVIPTTADNFRAGLRSLKLSGGGASGGEDKTKVGYAWVSVAQDVDWEGDDIATILGNVIRLALEHECNPVVPRICTTDEYSPEYQWRSGVVPFDKAPDIFINGDGPLSSGGTMVVRIAQ